MAQNFRTIYFPNNNIVNLFEAPATLTRVFWGIYIVAKSDPSFQVNVSFGDQEFLNPLCVTYCRGYYEFTGPDIPQGNVFARAVNFAQGTVCSTEILK